MENSSIRHLLEKYISDTLSPEEAQHLQLLLNEDGGFAVEKELRNIFNDGTYDLPESQDRQERLRNKILQRIKNEPDHQPSQEKRPVKLQLLRYAAMFILAALGIYIVSSNKAGSIETAATNKKMPGEIRPGGDVASLTLSDGTVVVLDSSQKGLVAQQGATRLTAPGSGVLAYKGKTVTSGELLFNTLRTPPGGQYQLELSDGTRVWLNAASSLRFPASFTGPQRSVELTGEAYFEVAKNKDKPFIVSTQSVKIKVLGTRFNVKEYDNEGQARTTLCEGSIKISDGNNANVLVPGQQAVSEYGSISLLNNVNMEQALAWKNGVFYFDGADLPSVMREIERWYDIKVTYPGQPPEFKFHGKLPRNLSLAQVLKVLTETEVKYTLRDRNLTILSE